MLAVVAGFLGVMLVIHPGFGTLHWAMLLALVATFGYALYNLATRYLSAFDPARVTQTYTPLCALEPRAALSLGIRSRAGHPALHAARRLCDHGPLCVRRMAVVARPEAVAPVRLARLLGRARACCQFTTTYSSF